MYVMSIVFLIAAVVSLAIGFFQDDELTLVYVSIAASGVSAIFWVLGIVRKRPIGEATAGAPYGPEEGTREPVAAAPRAARRPARPRPAETVAATQAKIEAAAAAPPVSVPSTKTTAKKPAAKKPAAKPAATASAAKKVAAKKSTAASSRSQVVALPERGTYHRPDCRHVKGRRDTERITVATAKRREYTACGTCKPAA